MDVTLDHYISPQPPQDGEGDATKNKRTIRVLDPIQHLKQLDYVSQLADRIKCLSNDDDDLSFEQMEAEAEAAEEYGTRISVKTPVATPSSTCATTGATTTPASSSSASSSVVVHFRPHRRHRNNDAVGESKEEEQEEARDDEENKAVPHAPTMAALVTSSNNNRNDGAAAAAEEESKEEDKAGTTPAAAITTTTADAGQRKRGSKKASTIIVSSKSNVTTADEELDDSIYHCEHWFYQVSPTAQERKTIVHWNRMASYHPMNSVVLSLDESNHQHPHPQGREQQPEQSQHQPGEEHVLPSPSSQPWLGQCFVDYFNCYGGTKYATTSFDV